MQNLPDPLASLDLVVHLCLFYGVDEIFASWSTLTFKMVELLSSPRGSDIFCRAGKRRGGRGHSSDNALLCTSGH